MKKLFAGLIFATLISVAANAQSAQKITEIDESGTISYGQFCYLIATSTSIISDDSTYQQAFDEIRKTGVFYSDVSATDPIPLSDIAMLCSKTWKIEASLMYKLTKAPRYAFRQLQALEIIPLTSNPTSYSSGHQVLNIVTLCIDYDENR